MTGARRRFSADHSRITSSRDHRHTVRSTSGGELATSLERIAHVIGAIIAPITVLAALLFYFGWIRTNALFQHFGIDAPILGFSNQDYMLRSAESLYVPLGILLAVGLGGLWTHGLVLRMLDIKRRRKMLRIAAGVLVLGGLALFGIGVAGIVAPDLFRKYTLVAPLCLGSGAVTIAYGRWLWQRLHEIYFGGTTQPRWSIIVNFVLIALLVSLSLFWAATEYAAALGRGRAEEFARELSSRPGVIVYSTDRIFLQGSGIIEETLPAEPHSGYRYRYSGLRLLTEANNRFFLLPEDWTRGHNSTIILDNNDKIRIEFIPGRGT